MGQGIAVVPPCTFVTSSHLKVPVCCCRSFLKALLPHLPRAQALLDWMPPAGAESTGTDQRARLLDLLAALLRLSAPSLLNPQQPAFRFVCSAYAELLRIRHGSSWGATM